MSRIPIYSQQYWQSRARKHSIQSSNISGRQPLHQTQHQRNVLGPRMAFLTILYELSYSLLLILLPSLTIVMVSIGSHSNSVGEFWWIVYDKKYIFLKEYIFSVCYFYNKNDNWDTKAVISSLNNCLSYGPIGSLETAL